MSDKMLVYYKQTGENPTPVTVRVEWLPDGTVKPIMYWTPDGSCYEVKHIFECTQMAHLKERDVGVRFKVRAEVIETPESYPDHRYAHHETYLYFADSWFCGRNIIDSRYEHNGKEFIHVTLDVFSDCGYEIVYFRVKDESYQVEKTLVIEPRSSYSAGGVGIRHKVDAHLVNKSDGDDVPHKNVRRIAALYFEINKWFVSIGSK